MCSYNMRKTAIGEEKSTFHFCDSIGFREVDFDPDMTEPLKEKKIKVVLCEPGKVARVAEIGTELSDLQRVLMRLSITV